MVDFLVGVVGVFGALAEEWQFADLRREIAEVWQDAVSWIELFEAGVGKKTNLPNFLGMAGIALLTVMIPVAVAIFGEKGAKGEYEILDRNVMLDYVVKAKWLLGYMGLVFVPLFLWGNFPYWVCLFFWVCGVGGMAHILIKSYAWMKGDKFDFREGYLQKLGASDNSEGLAKLWRSVWEVANIDTDEESKFFKVFFQSIGDLLGKDKPKAALELMKGFNLFFDKRTFIPAIVFGGNFSKILEWHFSVWKKESNLGELLGGAFVIEQQNPKNVMAWFLHNDLFMQLSATVEKIQENALGKRGCHPLAFHYFLPAFERHIEKHVASMKEGGECYVDGLVRNFFASFTKNIIEGGENFSEKNDLWQSFPSKWKITTENMKNNYVSAIVAEAFLGWAREKIPLKGGCDAVVFNAVINLLPRVCPMMWGRILAFQGREPGSGVKSLVERPLNFDELYRAGFSEFIMGLTCGGDSGEKESIALALAFARDLHWLQHDFSEEKLKEHIAELESMRGDYIGEEKKRMEAERVEYIRIFRKLLAAKTAGG